jgi:hypothetical protein
MSAGCYPEWVRATWLSALALTWTVTAEAHLSRPTLVDPEPLHFDAEDRVLTHSSPGGRFQVFYVIDGRNGVGSVNSDGDAIVDRIERMAEAYDEAYATFTSTLGFAPPPSDEQAIPENGGDDRIDVYVLDTGDVAGGRLIEGCPGDIIKACWSFIVHPIASTDDRLFARRALFNVILAGYRPYYAVPLEIGSSAWAAGDEIYFGQHPTELALGDPKVALDGGTSAFLGFLSDRHGSAPILALWTQVAAEEPPPDWKPALDALLQLDGGSLADEFVDFSIAMNGRIDPVPEAPPVFEALSARYYSGPVHVGGADRLRVEVGDAVTVVVNGSLDPIQPTELCEADPEAGGCASRGCECAAPSSSPSLILFALLLFSARRGAGAAFRRAWSRAVPGGCRGARPGSRRDARPRRRADSSRSTSRPRSR